jgi:hypothetical protein
MTMRLRRRFLNHGGESLRVRGTARHPLRTLRAGIRAMVVELSAALLADKRRTK